MDRKAIIKTALANRGALIHTKDMNEATVNISHFQIQNSVFFVCMIAGIYFQ
jgi:hypothetical protein